MMSTMKTQRLHRAWYPTDVTEEDAEYVGAFSAPFPAESAMRRIVNVDWSTPGEVQVTWLVGA